MPIYNPAPQPISTSSGATTPTAMQGNLTVADYTQMVFRRKIVTQAGQRIIIGINSALIGV